MQPSASDHNQQTHSTKTNRRPALWYAWWVALAGGLVYLIFLSPGEVDTTSTKEVKQSTESEIQPELFKAAMSKEAAFPFPTNFPQPTTEPSPTSTLPPTATPTAEAVLVTHIVEAGEMPLSIAAQYDIDLDTLLAANSITDPTLLQIGQELVIPITVTPTPLPPTATPTPDKPLPPTATPQLHVVEAGDTPLSIAIQYDVTPEILMRFNRIFNPSGLQIGQELFIPNGDELPELAIEAPTALHNVSAGDTLLALTYRYGSTVEEIMELNPDLDPTALQIGEQIIIPLTRPRGTSYAPSSSYSPAPPVIIPDPPSPGIVGLQQQMILAVNAHRAAHGLPPYTADPQLSQIALARAQDMDARGYFGHWTPEGKRAKDFVREQGIEAKWVSENIERNVKPESETVAHSINWFMNDAPHRYNILHPHYTRIGVGVSNNHHFHTFVLIFAGE